MITISNQDAKAILQLLKRGNAFYGNHAVRAKDRDDGRLMAKMSAKLDKIISTKKAQQQ